MRMLSLYDVTIPVFIRAFGNLDALLDKGAAHVAAEGRPESALTEARLIEDMRPLTAQIQRASDTARGVAVRVGGIAPAPMADEEQTIAALKQRIARTVDYLRAVPRAAFDDKEEIAVAFKAGARELTFTGRSYVLDFALPNFFFHITTAYALLRKEGVPIGKTDYLGAL
jgi:hypothetical protein